VFFSCAAGLLLPSYFFMFELTSSMPSLKKIVLPTAVGFGLMATSYSYYKYKLLEKELDIKYTPVWLKLSKR